MTALPPRSRPPGTHGVPSVAGAAAVAPPAPGDYAEVADGILWVRLPIPGGLNHINVWLLPTAGGWHLVDTGMKTEVVQQAWEAMERRLPLRRDLQDILVTHHHPDHFGMAQWLAQRYARPVTMTPAAHAAAIAGLAPDTPAQDGRSRGFAERAGFMPDEGMQRILRGNVYRNIVSGPVELRPLMAGDVVPGLAGGWRVSVHDGHAPGHACLFQPDARVLVSGDQLLPAISSNVSLYPSNEQADPLGQYLDSLRELSELPQGTLVLPSHGQPFRSLHARAAQLLREHESRLDRIRELLSAPIGTLDVASRLFRLERLDGLNRLLAVTETLAHLRWLELRGLAVRRGTGAALRWSAAPGNP